MKVWGNIADNTVEILQNKSLMMILVFPRTHCSFFKRQNWGCHLSKLHRSVLDIILVQVELNWRHLLPQIVLGGAVERWMVSMKLSDSALKYLSMEAFLADNFHFALWNWIYDHHAGDDRTMICGSYFLKCFLWTF